MARESNRSLMVMCAITEKYAQPPRTVDHPLGHRPNLLVKASLDAADGYADTPIEVVEIRNPDPAKAILEEVESLGIEQVVVGADVLADQDDNRRESPTGCSVSPPAGPWSSIPGRRLPMTASASSSRWKAGSPATPSSRGDAHDARHGGRAAPHRTGHR